MRVLAVLGGDGIGTASIKAWAAACDMIIAADSGIHYLEEASVNPDMIVGDMDSAINVTGYTHEAIHIDHDEDRSDLQKLLNKAGGLGAKEVVLTCIHGGRMDHFLASFSAAIATEMDIRWVLLREHAVLIRPNFRGTFSTGVAKIISLIPLDGDCVVSTQGLRWDLGSELLRVGHHLSLSNVSEHESFSVHVSGGHLVMMVEQPPNEVPLW